MSSRQDFAANWGRREGVFSAAVVGASMLPKTTAEAKANKAAVHFRDYPPMRMRQKAASGSFRQAAVAPG